MSMEQRKRFMYCIKPCHISVVMSKMIPVSRVIAVQHEVSRNVREVNNITKFYFNKNIPT